MTILKTKNKLNKRKGYIMERYLTWIQFFLAGAIAWLSNRLGILLPLLALLCGFMTVDYITGMLASKAEAIDHPESPAYGWCSKKGARGILKKVGYISVIAVAISLDYLIMVLAGHLGIEAGRSVFFGLLTTSWYILNELLSIIENAGRMGANVPEWLSKYIAVLKDKIDNKGSGDK